MDSNLRPLIANLRKLQINKYLITDSFSHTLFEVGYDEKWRKYLDNHLEKSGAINYNPELVYPIVFESLTASAYNDFFGFHKYMLPIVKDFLIWKKDLTHLNDIKDALRQLSISAENINKCMEQIESRLSPKNESKDIILETSKLNEVKHNQKDIFIVHGHDKVARLELKEILKEEFKLNPIILQDKPNDTLETIFSKLDKHARICPTAIILMTPDDVIDAKKQARPNVLIELGYFLGLYPPDNRRIIILRKDNCDIPSDIHGVQRFDFKESVEETQTALQKQFKHWKLID